jgi:hypothetical protein
MGPNLSAVRANNLLQAWVHWRWHRHEHALHLIQHVVGEILRIGLHDLPIIHIGWLNRGRSGCWHIADCQDIHSLQHCRVWHDGETGCKDLLRHRMYRLSCEPARCCAPCRLRRPAESPVPTALPGCCGLTCLLLLAKQHARSHLHCLAVALHICAMLLHLTAKLTASTHSMLEVEGQAVQ